MKGILFYGEENILDMMRETASANSELSFEASLVLQTFVTPILKHNM
jgi:hypothetical protein